MARGKAAYQTTLLQRATLKGIGVHGGQDVSLTLHPAEPDSGIYFLRTDMAHGCDREISANYQRVGSASLCTVIGEGDATVATIEHLMAALSAAGVDNAMIEVDGPELPIMDGSAAPFVEAIEIAGVVELDKPRRYIKVLEPVSLAIGESQAEFRPYDGFRLDISIDFDCPQIGQQTFAADIEPELFATEMARARTFGFLSDVEQLWQRGFALGASLENTVVVGDDKIVNPEGLRFDDEFVRHKAVDALGDLALAGAPILGSYRSYRGGHMLNVKAVEALLARETAWTMVEAPVRRDSGHAELHAGVGVAAYGPDAS